MLFSNHLLISVIYLFKYMHLLGSHGNPGTIEDVGYYCISETKMKIVLLLAIFGALGLAEFSAASNPAQDICAFGQKCQGEDVKQSPESLKLAMECMAEFKKDKENGKKDRKSGQTCLSVCIWRKLGIFDDAGVYHKEKNEASIESTYPASVRKSLKAELELCTSDSKGRDLSLNGTDSRCRNFKPLVRCALRANAKVCHKDFDEDMWEYDDCC